MLSKYLILSLVLILGLKLNSQINIKSYEEYYKAKSKGQERKASKLLNTILEVEKDEFFFNYKKAESCAQDRDFDSSAIYYARMINLKKSSINSYLFTSNSRETIRGIYNNALDVYDSVLLYVAENRAVNLCNRGIIKQELNRHEQAIDDFTLSLKIEPHYLTYYNRALSFENLELVSKAIKDYSESINLYSENGSAYLNRGFCYLKAEKYIEAEKDFILSLNFARSVKEQAYALNNLGFTHLKLAHYEKAKFYIQQSIDLFPTNSYAYKNMALVELQLKNNNQACELLLKSLELGYSEIYDVEVENLLKANCE